MKNLNFPLLPQDMNQYFAEAYNSGKVENLTRLFELNAKSVMRSGEILSNPSQLKEDHLKLLQLGGKMTSVNKHCIEFENIALLRADWIIETLDKEGKVIKIKGSSTEVVRKQSDGTWLYIIDHLFGAT